MKLLLRAVTKTTGDGVRAASRARARFHSTMYLQIYQKPRGDPLPTHRPHLASLPAPHLLISECVCMCEWVCIGVYALSSVGPPSGTV
jgi:hypothetical protein